MYVLMCAGRNGWNLQHALLLSCYSCDTIVHCTYTAISGGLGCSFIRLNVPFGLCLLCHLLIISLFLYGEIYVRGCKCGPE